MTLFLNNDRCLACKIQVKWTKSEKKATNHPSVPLPRCHQLVIWSTYLSRHIDKEGGQGRDRMFYEHGGDAHFNLALGQHCKEAVSPQSSPSHLFTTYMRVWKWGKGTPMPESFKLPNSDKLQRGSWLNYRSSLTYDEVISQQIHPKLKMHLTHLTY